MALDLRNLGKTGETQYIILNPERPPYIIHSLSPYWDKSTIDSMLQGYHVFKPVRKEFIETSKPVILACGGGFSIYILGKAVDKLRGGVFTYSLVKSILNRSLDGAGLKRVNLSITGLGRDLIDAVIGSFRPVALVSSIGEAMKLLQTLGFRLLYPERFYRRLKLSLYLREMYGISDGSEDVSRFEAVYRGIKISLCIGMYGEGCDLTVLEDDSALEGVNHISIYPDGGRLSLKLFI